MRTAAICPTCATYINALCVIYNGPNLTNTNVATLDNLETIVQNINDNLVPVSGSGAPSNNAVYEGQIYINNATGDVYIATATGGGPADWVELALQSVLPTAPSLDDVLLVGNTSTTSVVIQDLLVAPTQTNTMSPDNLQLFDSGQDLNTQYHVNDIYIEQLSTGDFLQIAIDNTQNQTITFPDTSGQLALLSDTQLSLQNVTDNGNLTNDPIFADSFASTPTYLSNDASLLGYVGDGVTAHGVLVLREDSDGTGFTSTITADIDLTADRTISIPDADGTMVLSVNGNIPDNQGNVVITSLATLQTVTAGLNKDLVDGNNFQGTNAGDTQTGIQVIAIGTNAAIGNTGNDIVSLGFVTGNGNIGQHNVFIGSNSGNANEGDNVISIGFGTADTNLADNLIAIGGGAGDNNSGIASIFIGNSSGQINNAGFVVGIGTNAGYNNSGQYSNFIGDNAGFNNTGEYTIGIGANAADSNSGDNVIAIGQNAGINNTLSGMTILANSSLPSYLNFAAASAAINAGTGASSGSTYLYHDQTTNSIGAVRIP